MQQSSVLPADATAPWGAGLSPPLATVDKDYKDFEENHSATSDSEVLNLPSTPGPQSDGVIDKVEVHGRIYHQYKEGKYPLPNDKQEQKRLDLQHTLFKILLDGKLHLAPLKANIKNVLDIGTGTGKWAIEFAQQYPSSNILGIDLSTIQPSSIPSNCHFQIHDLEDSWNLSKTFDYIHGRMLLACFKVPAAVLRQAFDSLAPGGYLEMQDLAHPHRYIGSVPTESHFYKWSQIIVSGGAKSGRPWTNAQHYARWMREIGFEDVVERIFYWPVGTWAEGEYYKMVGRYVRDNYLNGIEGISLKVMGVEGWEVEEARAFLAEVKKEIRGGKLRAYAPVFVVYGRKPGGPM